MAAVNANTIEKDVLQAVDLLNQAVARDPGFFLAHCLLAYANDRLYFVSIDRTPARLAKAQTALDAAARLQPDAGETHLARAFHLYWGSLDYAGALAELEAARRTLPNEARTYELTGFIVRRQGKHEESIRYLERALELDPRNFLTLVQIGLGYQIVRRYESAAATFDRAVSIYPDSFDAQTARAGLDILWKADLRAAQRQLDDLRRKDPVAFKERGQEMLTSPSRSGTLPARKKALAMLGDKPTRNNQLVFNKHANAGIVARLAQNDEKARAAYGAAREEQEKTVQAQPNSGPALALLALYKAELGLKEEALRDGRRAMELLPLEKDAVNAVRLIGSLCHDRGATGGEGTCAGTSGAGSATAEWAALRGPEARPRLGPAARRSALRSHRRLARAEVEKDGFAEPLRRAEAANVIRMAGLYLVGAWLVVR